MVVELVELEVVLVEVGEGVGVGYVVGVELVGGGVGWSFLRFTFYIN